MQVKLIGMDISKHFFQVHGADERGKAVVRKRLYRSDVREFFVNLSPCVVAMEACASAHYWARELKALGHEVKLIAPQFVKPYVRSNKNDRADAEAICEAASRPEMRFVAAKSVEQQDIQALHRVRERLVSARTALCNEIRGLLSEYGIIIAQGRLRLSKELSAVLEKNRETLTGMALQMFLDLQAELSRLTEQVETYDHLLERIHKAHPVCQQLTTIPGVGSITSTALIAMVGDVNNFKNGRQFAAYLGLVPKQHSTGGKNRLLGISKRGDTYLRKLLVHGARSVLLQAGKKSDQRSRWLIDLYKRRGTNRAVVALANKNARVIWAVMSKGSRYFASYHEVAA